MALPQLRNPRVTRNRRGNASIVVFSLASLLGFSALTVDHGMVRVTHAELQNAVDAAAYGGAVYLDRTNAGLRSAVRGAVRIGNANTTTFGTYQLTDSDVRIGYYDDQGTFVEVTDYDTDAPEMVNALQVSSSVPDITAVMSRVAFQMHSLQTSASAAVVRMPNKGVATSVPCALPLAIPDCEYLAYAGTGSNPPPTWFRFGPNNANNVGWADPRSTPNSHRIKNSLNEQCGRYEITTDDDMNLSSSPNNAALRYIGAIINGEGAAEFDSWPTGELGVKPTRVDASAANAVSASFVDSDSWGNTIQGPVALVDVGDCANPQLTGAMEITGFTWGTIYDGKDSGGNKNLVLQLDVINEHDFGGDISDDGYGNVTGLAAPISVP